MKMFLAAILFSQQAAHKLPLYLQDLGQHMIMVLSPQALDLESSSLPMSHRAPHICYICSSALLNRFFIEANSMNPNQTAPLGAAV